MKYVIGSAIIVAFTAGAYCAFRILAFKDALDAFAKDIGAPDGEKPASEKAANGRDTRAS